VEALLADLAARGIELQARGGRLRFRPADAVTPDLARRLKYHKDELLALLRADPAAAITPADLPPDWQFAWEERAAIMEYDGGLPREQADVLALADVLRQMRAAGHSG
jgi:hypothetical protein